MQITRINLYKPSFLSTLKDTDEAEKTPIKEKTKKTKAKKEENPIVVAAIEKARENGIYPLKEIGNSFKINPINWYRENCFNTSTISFPLKGVKPILALDLNDELNRQNIDLLKSNANKLLTKNQLGKVYNVTPMDITFYANCGFIEPFKLYANDEGEMVDLPLYDMVDSKNAEAFDKLDKKRSKINLALIKNNSRDVYANVAELERLACGTKKSIYKAIKSGRIVLDPSEMHKIDTNLEGINISLNNRQNVETLKILRNAITLDEEKARSVYGISRVDYYGAILDGGLNLLEAVFVGDMEQLSVGLKDKKSLKTYLNLIITSLAHERITSQSNDVCETLLLEVLSAFDTEIATKARELVKKDDELLEIIRKKVAFNNKCEKLKHLDKKEGFEQGEFDEEEQEIEEVAKVLEKLRLTERESKRLKEFDKELLSQIDFEQFKKAYIKAIKAMQEYKKFGRNGISDPIARKAIINYIQNKKY